MLQDTFEVLVEIGVFAPQVQDATAGADGVASDGHAFHQHVRPLGEKHAVLERARLSFVGVANDVLPIVRRLAGEFPFQPRREPSAPPASQARFLQDSNDSFGGNLHRPFEACSRRPVGEYHGARLSNVVSHGCTNQGMSIVAITDSRGKLVGIWVGAKLPNDLLGFFWRKVGDHRVVDQGGRCLVRHADAGSTLEAERAVGRNAPQHDTEFAFESIDHIVVAEHPVDDVIAHAYDDLAFASLTRRQEGVERGDALDLDAMKVQAAGDERDGITGDAAVAGLYGSADVQQTHAVVVAVVTDFFDGCFIDGIHS